MATVDVRRFALTPPLAAFLAAVLGHLPALRTFWSQDDWGLLARATGLTPERAVPARFLSQVLYWRALHPLFGLDPAPWAVTRLLLHGGSAALLARIAARCGLAPVGALAAGLLFAAAPVALAPVWSANAVQDLLALFLALAATERWLAALGRTPDGARDPAPARAGRDLALAGLFGALAMFAKESAFGLPVLWGALLLARRARDGGRAAAARWVVIGALLVVAAGEAVLVLRHFDRAAGAAYALGVPLDALFNLLIYGVWTVWPWPFYPTVFPPAFYAAALAVWLAWAACAAWRWRRGDRLCAAGLLAALLALAPLLPLAHHTIPYLVYPATAGLALALASLVPRRLAPRPVLPALLGLVAVAWSLALFSVWLRAPGSDGWPRDPLVAHTEISRRAMRLLRDLPRPPADTGGDGPDLILLQVPLTPAVAAQADRLDEHMVMTSRLHAAIGGEFGPRLVLGPGVRVRWANRLDTAPPGAFVLAEAGPRLIPWGQTGQARLYLTLALASRGCFLQAARTLLFAARQGGARLAFMYDPGQLLEPPAALEARAAAFDQYLAGPPGRGAGLSDEARPALRAMWRELLAVVREP
ncbi:MAG: hypothetical protein ACYDIE_00830 [Candidatus Krumholzibacteriia bacterium]